MHNRLTSAAAAELVSIRSLVQGVQLNDQRNVRRLDDGTDFSSHGTYKALSLQVTYMRMDLLSLVEKEVSIRPL